MRLYFKACFLFFGIFSNSVQIWQTVISQQIAHCQLTQNFGSGTVFVNENNHSITEFSFENNFTFGITLAPPGPKATFNTMLSLVCVDLVSAVCSDYVGPCPRSVFILSVTSPVISVINYQKAFSKYKIIHGKLTYLLQFLPTPELL